VTSKDLDNLVLAVDDTYLYIDKGTDDPSEGGIALKSKNDWFDYNLDKDDLKNHENDITYLLSKYKMDLNPFTADNAVSNSFDFYSSGKGRAVPGKYGISAINKIDETAKVLTASPLIVINGSTPIKWQDQYGTHVFPFTYTKGRMGDVTMGFTGANADIANIRKVVYLFIHSTASYNLEVTADPQLLAEKAENYWKGLGSDNPIIDMIYEGIVNDIGAPFTYKLTAIGKAAPNDANQWSVIAITPGYGISGKGSGTTVTIPYGAFESLDKGMVYVYLMGLDENNDIVAFDQTGMYINEGGAPASGPTVTAITPNAAARGGAVGFTITGTNFQSEFGNKGVAVNLTKPGNAKISGTITSTTATKITGTFDIPKTAELGKWNLVVTTPDGGGVEKPAFYTINDASAPTIGAVTTDKPFPRTEKCAINVTGTNFVLNGVGDTSADLINASGYGIINVTVAPVTSTTKLTGTFDIPTVPVGEAWTLIVTTNTGGSSVPKTNAVTIAAFAKPTIAGATIGANTFPRTDDVIVNITGTNFQTGAKTTAKFVNASGLGSLAVTLAPVTSNTLLSGNVDIPTTPTGEAWSLIVTTEDGGESAPRTNAMTIKTAAGVPTIASSVVGINTYPNTAGVFVNVTGTNYQLGTADTTLAFFNGTGGMIPVTVSPCTSAT